MRVLSLDFDPTFGNDAVRSQFAGDDSVFDFDLVIWDPASSYEWYTQYEDSYQGLPSLSDNSSVRLRADISRRKKEFAEFVNSGRTLVIITRPPQQCYAATGSVEHSGTGRNRATIRHVDKVDLLNALPVKTTQFLKARGTRIEVDGDGPLSSLLRTYRKDLCYEATMVDPPGSSLGHVVGTDRIVASVQRAKSGGHLVFLPTVNLLRDDDDELDEDADEEASLYRDNAWEFQRDLIETLRQLDGSTEISRPAWASAYSTSEQRRLSDETSKQQKRVETAREKLAKLQKDAQSAEARDQLYLGTGRALEVQVKGVLEALGGEVTEPDPGRDDWKVVFPEAKAVVEVKGVGKSAAEKHAAQLEKWVATELEASGSAPKGLLVVNTWKDISLEERTEPDFPAQMLPYSAGRDHCLMTGLQLFTILSEIEKDSSKAEFWRKKILKTAGVLEGAPDWRDVIQISKPQES